MEEIVLLEAVERYLNGDMTAQEKTYFEDLRSKNPEVDQMVVEQHLLLNQMKSYGERKQLNAQLSSVYNHLVETNEITEQAQAPVRNISAGYLWNKYRRTVAVAASIAGITALTISGLTSYFTPKNAVSEVEALKRDIEIITQKQNDQESKITQINGQIAKAPKDQQQRSAGTSFLIDAKGYLVTNSHVVSNANTLVVVNNGKEYYAKNIYSDPASDIAILKIDDKDFTPLSSLPYSIRKTNAKLGEEIFTLGYPRNEIVYDKGYLSAQSGFNDDTLSVQISVTANHGNSGGPVIDKNGDVIGILNSRERNVNGVVFANKAENIAKALGKLKEMDTTFRSIKLSATNTLKGKETTQQVEQIKGCVFMVKGYFK